MAGATEITGDQVTPFWSAWRTLGTGNKTVTPDTMMCMVTIMIPLVTRPIRVTMVEITTLRHGGDTPGPGIPRTEATPPMVTHIRMVTITIIRTSFTATGSRGTTRSTRRCPPPSAITTRRLRIVSQSFNRIVNLFLTSDNFTFLVGYIIRTKTAQTNRDSNRFYSQFRIWSTFKQNFCHS